MWLGVPMVIPAWFAILRDFTRGADSAPLSVKLYINRQSMGFSDTDDMEPAQTLELTPADLVAGSASVLKFVKFQRVIGLSVSSEFGFLLPGRGAAVFAKESAQPRYRNREKSDISGGRFCRMHGFWIGF